MLKLIYTILDTKAAAYLPPFYMRSNGEALRAFSDEISNGDSQIAKHPEDFILFQIGTFDEQTGELSPVSPISLAKAIDLVVKH